MQVSGQADMEVDLLCYSFHYSNYKQILSVCAFDWRQVFEMLFDSFLD